MQGKILDYNHEFKSGLIRGEDGNKYRFSIDDCKSIIAPTIGANVDFEPNGDKALEVYVLDQKTNDSTIKSEPKQTTGSETQKNMIIPVKKIAVWSGIGLLGFIALVFIINFVNDKNQDAKIRELRNGCANNDAKVCYELGMADHYGNGLFSSEEMVDIDEKNEALAKGCQLGNKDACREGGYDERGCELQDGESCFNLIQYGSQRPELIKCELYPDSDNCTKILKERSEYVKKYSNLACEYGYSQGCL